MAVKSSSWKPGFWRLGFPREGARHPTRPDLRLQRTAGPSNYFSAEARTRRRRLSVGSWRRGTHKLARVSRAHGSRPKLLGSRARRPVSGSTTPMPGYIWLQAGRLYRVTGRLQARRPCVRWRGGGPGTRGAGGWVRGAGCGVRGAEQPTASRSSTGECAEERAGHGSGRGRRGRRGTGGQCRGAAEARAAGAPGAGAGGAGGAVVRRGAGGAYWAAAGRRVWRGRAW